MKIYLKIYFNFLDILVNFANIYKLLPLFYFN